MKKETIYASLQLDSLLRVYTWEERITCHELIIGKQVRAKTENIERVCKWIEENEWKAPTMTYRETDDAYQKLFYIENGVYTAAEMYKKFHQEIFNNLKFYKNATNSKGNN